MAKNSSSENIQIKIGAILSYLTIIINILAGLIYTPWMINEIGQSDYGLYSLVISFIGYFTMDFGLGSAVSRFVSKGLAKNDEDEVGKMLGLIFKAYFVITALISIVLLALFFHINQIFVQLTPEELVKFRIVYVIAGLFGIISFPFTPLNGILISYEYFGPLKMCDLLNKFITIALMIVCLFKGGGLYALVFVNAGVSLFIILIKLIVIKKGTSFKVQWRYRDNRLLKSIFSFSIWSSIIIVAQQLLINITPTVLSVTSGTVAISIFAIGNTIQGYTWSIANALNGLFMCKVTRMENEKNDTAINHLMIRIGRIQLLIIGALVIGFLVLGKEFIYLWLGEAFEDAYYVALLLISPSLITVTEEIANTKLYVVNEIKFRAIFFIGASILSVIISFVLSPELGAIGSAIGIFTATVLCHVIAMNAVYYKVLNIDIFAFFRECHGKIIIPLFVCAGFGFLLVYAIPGYSWLKFILSGIMYVLFYTLIMWIFVMNEGEKDIFRRCWKILGKLLVRKKG